MLIKFLTIVILTLISGVFCAPQFLNFKDGNVEVNFGGYYAKAGLGGLLTGNAAHGGLQAAAGTPFGQRAGAGIGGTLDGRSAGGAYAGASAGYGIGASAAIGGGLGDDGAHGGVGAESHVGGLSRKVVKLAQAEPSVEQVRYVETTVPEVTAHSHSNVEGGISVGGAVKSSPQFHLQKEIKYTNNIQPADASGSIQGGLTTTQYHTNNIVKSPSFVQVEKQVYVDQQPKVQQDDFNNVVSVQSTGPVYQIHKYRKSHRIRPHHRRIRPQKVFYAEKRFEPQPQQQQQQQQIVYNQRQPAAFDYRKFFDFGFFSNTAAGFGGPHSTGGGGGGGGQIQTVIEKEVVAPQQQQQYQQPQQQSQIVYEKRVVPKVVYEKRIVPETVVIEKTIQPSEQNVDQEVQYEKIIDNNNNYYVGKTGGIYGSGGFVAGGGGGYNNHGGRTIFDDIFAIPITTLQGVNNLLNHKSAGGGGGIQIHKSIEFNG